MWVGGRCRERLPAPPPPRIHTICPVLASLSLTGVSGSLTNAQLGQEAAAQSLKALWLRCWPRVQDPLLSGLF